MNNGQITAEDAKLPNLGELPPAEDSPPPDSEDEDREDEDDEEDEDEDEDEDDSDEEGVRSRRRRRRRSMGGGRDRHGDDEAHKKRGRPPSVLTPMEARIHSILRSLRKPKDQDGNLLVVPFEKLPDKVAVPDYYQTITQPIALDQIKKKAKRKKYQNVDHVLADIDLMFQNAKLYNEDDSDVYKAAVDLEKQAHISADQEKAKPDDDFRDEDGKLPLAEIQHGGDTWRVGTFREQMKWYAQAHLTDNLQGTGFTFVTPTTWRSPSLRRSIGHGKIAKARNGSTLVGTTALSRQYIALKSTSSNTK